MVDKLDLKQRFPVAGVSCPDLCSDRTTLAGFSSSVSLVSRRLPLWPQGLICLLVTGVDMVLGPDPHLCGLQSREGWKHLQRDLAVIGAIQLAAVATGCTPSTSCDRWRWCSGRSVPGRHRCHLQAGFPRRRQVPVASTISRPVAVGHACSAAGQGTQRSPLHGSSGADIADPAVFWQHFAKSAGDAIARPRHSTRCLTTLRGHAEIKAELAAVGADLSTARFLPLVARSDWVVVLDGAAVRYWIRSSQWLPDGERSRRRQASWPRLAVAIGAHRRQRRPSATFFNQAAALVGGTVPGPYAAHHPPRGATGAPDRGAHRPAHRSCCWPPPPWPRRSGLPTLDAGALVHQPAGRHRVRWPRSPAVQRAGQVGLLRRFLHRAAVRRRRRRADRLLCRSTRRLGRMVNGSPSPARSAAARDGKPAPAQPSVQPAAVVVVALWLARASPAADWPCPLLYGLLLPGVVLTASRTAWSAPLLLALWGAVDRRLVARLARAAVARRWPA